MKEELIDTESSNQHCLDFVGKVFHSDAHTDARASEGLEQARGHEEAAARTKTCHSMYGGLCQKTSQRQLICKLVRMLNRCLTEHGLGVGSLLSITTSATSFLGFLGTCMQKPHLHMLVKAHLDIESEEVSFFEEGETSPRPVLLTSHQLFHQLGVNLNENIKCEVWGYQVLLRGSGLLLQTSAVTKSFTLSPAMKLERKKPRRSLRFGLKAPNRKRKTRKKTQQGTGKKPRISKDVSGITAGASAASSVEPAKEIDVSSSCSSASRASSSETDGESDKEPLFDEEEVYVPTSHAASVEEAEASKLILEHETLVATNEAAAAPALAQSSAASTGRIQGGEFSFACVAGVASVSIAVSARSVCYYCGNRIPKATARFCFYHNVLRPSAWVHPKCLPHLLKRDGFVQQGRDKLSQLEPGTGLPQDDAAKISAAIRDVRAALL